MDQAEFGYFSSGSKDHRGYVKGLKLDAHIAHSRMLDMPTAFPSLTSLIVTSFDCCTSIELPLFNNLKYLKLNYLNSCFPFNFLTAMSYVTRLEIHAMGCISISINLLNGIHRACVLLEYIYLESVTIDIPNKSEINLVERCGKLKTFGLMSSRAMHQHHLWLQYVANRYPNIEVLKLGCGTGEQTGVSQHPVDFYDGFYYSCPLIAHFEWCNIIPDDRLLKRLNKQQQQLLQLKLLDSNLIEHVFLEIVSHRYIYLYTILNLKIVLPKSMSSNTLAELLGRTCPQLQQLAFYSKKPSNADKLYVDCMLDIFPCMVSLDFQGLELRIKQVGFKQCQQQGLAPYMLNKLKCMDCRLSSDVFDYIAIRCPDLQYLYLYRTIHPCEDYRVKIHLPYQRIFKLEIQDIRIEGKSNRKRTEIFHVDLKHQSDWYYHSNNKTNSLVRMNEADIQVFSSTLSQLCNNRQDSTNHFARYKEVLMPSIFDKLRLHEIIDKGYIDLACKSVGLIYFNLATPEYI
ncbi:hypothetical protein A0J61_04170 [Choanephora cucurbitarum]|uniref:F-box domain-containing protein n=1 Tax=Choanephora cucurbitarum TaxID=101091 RepID=A0A1C7NF82_9FUNG|nr:hypothetical protein A0J61_04170 [Choanephora cucurbitarum]